MMPFGPAYMYNPWPIALFAVFLLVLLASFALLVALLIRAASHPGPRHDSAVTILRERYARGDISRDEFERLRNELA